MSWLYWVSFQLLMKYEKGETMKNYNVKYGASVGYVPRKSYRAEETLPLGYVNGRALSGRGLGVPIESDKKSE